MIDTIQIEICAGGYQDVKEACQFSEVDRIELNSGLELGGLTPSLSTFRLARQYTDKKIICMVRPRTAGFVYTEAEKKVIFQDAQTFLEEGADGIVFGFLNEDNTIDTDATSQMVSLIHGYGKEAVFHKAFDETEQPRVSCSLLIDLGIQRILTSGHEETTLKGIETIRSLQEEFGNEIEILPGGGITADNIVTILQQSGCTQFHMTAKSNRNDNGTYQAVDASNIRKVLRQIEYSLQENHHIKTREDDAMLWDNKNKGGFQC